MKTQFKIIPDKEGYKFIIRRWWFPFWVSIRVTTEKAKEYLTKYK